MIHLNVRKDTEVSEDPIAYLVKWQQVSISSVLPPELRSLKESSSHFKVKSKSISGDIQLVKALEGRVGNLIHLAKHHPRQLCVL